MMETDNPFSLSWQNDKPTVRERTQSWSKHERKSANHALEAQINKLKEEMALIKKENDELKKVITELQSKKSYTPANSSEEEELVAKETAWVLNKNKKRRMINSPEKIVENDKESKAKPPIRNKPPPIIISNLENYSNMNKILKEANIDYKANVLNNNQLKLNVATDIHYRDISKLLNNENVEWHSFENKQTRPIRVVARNLHPTYDTEEIKSDLLKQGLKAIDVHNKIKKSKINEKTIIIPLPLFVLTFENTEDINKIFDITYICHTKVIIEPLRRNTSLPQCKKCQRYGHTQKFCQRKPVCVKCAGDHLTVNCDLPKDNKAKCFNCGGDHPANYRGCMVAKELQKRRDGLLKNKSKDGESKDQQKSFQSKKVSKEMSYASAAMRGSSETAIPPQASNTAISTSNEYSSNKNVSLQSILEQLQQVLTKMDTLTDRMDRYESRFTGTIPKRST